MKKLLHLSIFILIITTFYGCPVGIEYPLGNIGKEKIDKTIIGTWLCSAEDPEVKKVTISRKDDYSYTVKVLEKGSMYSLESDDLTGWTTEVDGKTFLFFRENTGTTYYHYMINESGKNKMTTCDVSLLDGGVDAVTSTEAFRTQVSSSMKMAEYCAETLNWTKE